MENKKIVSSFSDKFGNLIQNIFLTKSLLSLTKFNRSNVWSTSSLDAFIVRI